MRFICTCSKLIYQFMIHGRIKISWSWSYMSSYFTFANGIRIWLIFANIARPRQKGCIVIIILALLVNISLVWSHRRYLQNHRSCGLSIWSNPLLLGERPDLNPFWNKIKPASNVINCRTDPIILSISYHLGRTMSRCERGHSISVFKIYKSLYLCEWDQGISWPLRSQTTGVCT